MNKQKRMLMNVVSKPMLKNKWANKKRCFRESLITYKMKMRQGRGSRRDSITHIKEAACHQIEAATDATATIGKGLKKSISTYRKEAGRFARSLGEFVDVEDILKSIHQVARPEEHARRKTSIVHTPIDWTKRTVPASEKCPTIFENEEEEGFYYGDYRGEKDKRNASEKPVCGVTGPRTKGRSQRLKTMPVISISSVQKLADEHTIYPIRGRPSTSSLHLAKKDFDEPRVRLNERRPSTIELGLAQNTFDEQNIKSSRRRVSTSSISSLPRGFEQQQVVLRNRRLSTSSLSEAQKDFEREKMLSGRRLSSSGLGLQDSSFKEENKITSSRRLSTSIVNQVDHTHTPSVGNTSTHVRRSSVPHTFYVSKDGSLSSRKSSQNSLQTDQISCMYNQQSDLLTESRLPLYSRRQSCQINPIVEQINSSTKERRRISCFLNVKSGNANSAFRCKSPVMGKRSSYAGVDIC